MKTTVADVMNREILYLAEGARPELARGQILRFGVTAVPVLDEAGRAVGMLSLRDMLGDGPAEPTQPVFSIPVSMSVEAAARALAETNYHHAVVEDASNGRAVGMVSAMDLLRGVLGMRAHHPAGFPAFRRSEPAR